MLQVNLLPWRANERRKRQRFLLYHVVLVVVLSLSVAVLWWGLIQRELAEQGNATQRWTRLQIQLGIQLNKVHDASGHLQALQLAANQRQQRYENSIGYLSLLHALSRHIPDDVWLTKITETPGGWLRLQGGAGAYHSVVAFAQALNKEPTLADVRLLDMQRQPNHPLHFFMQLRLAATNRH